MHNFNFVEGETLLVNKELSWTSFDVVNSIRSSLRHALKIKKIKVGHAGTLDPLATGLLIVCTGKHTKTIDLIQAKDKVYSGTFILGATRPSQDKETEIDQTFEYSHITEEAIHEVAKGFIGDQNQIPPMFSAIKVDGTRAYMLAREDKSVEMKARPVQIFSFEITHINMPEVGFRIKCGKGTYIRSIARDFGERLQSGAYLGSLCREKIGDFSLDDSLTTSQIKNLIDAVTEK
jgi:tRNA pseudouridine55 synthase